MIDLVFSLTLSAIAFTGIAQLTEADDEFWRENCKQHYERNYLWQSIPSPG